MAVKKYGVYLNYSPEANLRVEGLGRHLVMFLKGAADLEGIHFTLVCPSWSKKELEQLFESEGIYLDTVKIVCPIGKPYILRLFQAWRERSSKRRPKGWLTRSREGLQHALVALWQHLTYRIAAIHSPCSFLGILLESIFLFLPAMALFLIILLTALPLLIIQHGHHWLKNLINLFVQSKYAHYLKKLSSLLYKPQAVPWVLRLFYEMQKAETQRMQSIIRKLTYVKAWYCPTSFWPAINDIQAPCLICVPDVVPIEFAIGFSDIDGDKLLEHFENIRHTIQGGKHFVTYSETVKWGTLVDKYDVPAAHIDVIPHAANDLSGLVRVQNFFDTEKGSLNYCKHLLMHAIEQNGKDWRNQDVRFFFYASQSRPNKNILTLLRAYEYLLRKRHIGHKLVLTTANIPSPISNFIKQYRLENDVIFLKQINASELAAYYKLADLAINPSLSEGGMPFTFTEALSVGTPVIMARISVTEEILTEPDLQNKMLFEPYNWHDLAARIEWALTHRAELLSLQQKTFSELSKRSWSHVVTEYVQVLDRIAASPPQVFD